MSFLTNKFKKVSGATGIMGMFATVKAMGWGLVVLIVFVILVAIAICLLLKRLSDIPPIDREKQIRMGWGWGDMYEVYTNKGLPPSFTYVQGVDEWPMDYYNTHPLTNNGVVYDYFELVMVAPPKPHDVLVCMKLGEWSNLATVGEGAYTTGFTNQDLEVWSAGGEWNIQPTKYALTNYSSMFWTAIPKNSP